MSGVQMANTVRQTRNTVRQMKKLLEKQRTKRSETWTA